MGSKITNLSPMPEVYTNMAVAITMPAAALMAALFYWLAHFVL